MLPPKKWKEILTRGFSSIPACCSQFSPRLVELANPIYLHFLFLRANYCTLSHARHLFLSTLSFRKKKIIFRDTRRTQTIFLLSYFICIAFLHELTKLFLQYRHKHVLKASPKNKKCINRHIKTGHFKEQQYAVDIVINYK